MPATADLIGLYYKTLIPARNAAGNSFILAMFDSTVISSEKAGTYVFRQEEVEPGHVITVKRVKVFYRDAGITTLTVTVTAINQWDGGSLSATQTKTFGTVGANGDIRSVFFDVFVTGERPQLTLTRDASAGNLAITKIVMFGTDEGGDQA